MKTPEKIAQETLDVHAILPHWRRDGEQIKALITEAIEADRAQRDERDVELVAANRTLRADLSEAIRELSAAAYAEGTTEAASDNEATIEHWQKRAHHALVHALRLTEEIRP